MKGEPVEPNSYRCLLFVATTARSSSDPIAIPSSAAARNSASTSTHPLRLITKPASSGLCLSRNAGTCSVSSICPGSPAPRCPTSPAHEAPTPDHHFATPSGPVEPWRRSRRGAQQLSGAELHLGGTHEPHRASPRLGGRHHRAHRPYEVLVTTPTVSRPASSSLNGMGCSANDTPPGDKTHGGGRYSPPAGAVKHVAMWRGVRHLRRAGRTWAGIPEQRLGSKPDQLRLRRLQRRDDD